MNVFKIMTSNYVINVGVAAWFCAGFLKLLFTLIFTRKIVWERLVGAGGMPSTHSALVASIAVAIQNKLGFSSPEFGLALTLAAIVMYDAMGVRRAAGEQAKVLNRIVFEFTNFPWFGQPQADKSPEEALVYEDEPEYEAKGEEIEGITESQPLLSKELKEFLGHTPLEVLAGSLVGILVAIFMPVV